MAPPTEQDRRCRSRGRLRAVPRPAMWSTMYWFTCSARSGLWPTTYTWWRIDERRIADSVDLPAVAWRPVHLDAERRARDLEFGIYFFAASARGEFLYSSRIQGRDGGLSVRRAVRLDTG